MLKINMLHIGFLSGLSGHRFKAHIYKTIKENSELVSGSLGTSSYTMLGQACRLEQDRQS